MLCEGDMNNPLRVAHNDYDSSFEDLLIKNKSSIIHQQNLKRLAIEILKINRNPDFMNDIFRFHESSHTLKNEPFLLKTRHSYIWNCNSFLHM